MTCRVHIKDLIRSGLYTKSTLFFSFCVRYVKENFFLKKLSAHVAAADG